jgi:hypothetical protein
MAGCRSHEQLMTLSFFTLWERLPDAIKIVPNYCVK